jgi:hypothetical protein
MGKKKHSTFIRQQKNNQRVQNKYASNVNHSVNRSTKRVNALYEDYNNFVNTTMDKFLVENGLESVPKNSRILVYEILKKNLSTKIKSYEDAITKLNPDDENSEDLKTQYNEAIDICESNISQINNVYNWTEYLSGDREKDEYDSLTNEEAMTKANDKLTESKLKFENLSVALDAINNYDKKDIDLENLTYYFYSFCRYILRCNDIDKNHTFISGVIKNLSVINTDDPINKHTLNWFYITGGDNTDELSIPSTD